MDKLKAPRHLHYGVSDEGTRDLFVTVELTDDLYKEEESVIDELMEEFFKDYEKAIQKLREVV